MVIIYDLIKNVLLTRGNFITFDANNYNTPVVSLSSSLFFNTEYLLIRHSNYISCFFSINFDFLQHFIFSEVFFNVSIKCNFFLGI